MMLVGTLPYMLPEAFLAALRSEREMWVERWGEVLTKTNMSVSVC